MTHAEWDAWFSAVEKGRNLNHLLWSIPDADVWVEAARVIKAVILYGERGLLYTDQSLLLADEYDLVAHDVGERHYFRVGPKSHGSVAR